MTQRHVLLTKVEAQTAERRRPLRASLIAHAEGISRLHSYFHSSSISFNFTLGEFNPLFGVISI